MGYSHSLNVPLHKIASAKGKEQLNMKPDGHYRKQVIKVNIMSSKDKSPTQIPSSFSVSDSLCQIISRGTSYLSCLGSNPLHGATFACGALFPLLGL